MQLKLRCPHIKTRRYIKEFTTVPFEYLPTELPVPGDVALKLHEHVQIVASRRDAHLVQSCTWDLEHDRPFPLEHFQRLEEGGFFRLYLDYESHERYLYHRSGPPYPPFLDGALFAAEFPFLDPRPRTHKPEDEASNILAEARRLIREEFNCGCFTNEPFLLTLPPYPSGSSSDKVWVALQAHWRHQINNMNYPGASLAMWEPPLPNPHARPPPRTSNDDAEILPLLDDMLSRARRALYESSIGLGSLRNAVFIYFPSSGSPQIRMNLLPSAGEPTTQQCIMDLWTYPLVRPYVWKLKWKGRPNETFIGSFGALRSISGVLTTMKGSSLMMHKFIAPTLYKNQHGNRGIYRLDVRVEHGAMNKVLPTCSLPMVGWYFSDLVRRERGLNEAARLDNVFIPEPVPPKPPSAVGIAGTSYTISPAKAAEIAAYQEAVEVYKKACNEHLSKQVRVVTTRELARLDSSISSRKMRIFVGMHVKELYLEALAARKAIEQ